MPKTFAAEQAYAVAVRELLAHLDDVNGCVDRRCRRVVGGNQRRDR
jgi:hypothetical protein